MGPGLDCMRNYLTWAQGAILLVAFGGAASAEVYLSQSNDPSGGLDGRMIALLTEEKAAWSTLSEAEIKAILIAPQKAASPEPVAETIPTGTPDAPKAAESTGSQIAVGAVQPVIAKVVPLSGASRTVAAKPLSLRLFAGLKPKNKVTPIPLQISFDPAWWAKQPAKKGDAEWACLTKALYFEARGESIRGQVAVAEVILNRVSSGAYPRSICGVVNQGAGSRLGCQFSYVCDGQSDTMNETGARIEVGKIAALMIAGAPRVLTDGATHFHTAAVRPSWARKFPQTAVIGAHYFYRQPVSIASS